MLCVCVLVLCCIVVLLQPLNAMLGATRMLFDCDLAADQVQFVDLIASSGELLLGIINDVLDLVRIHQHATTNSSERECMLQSLTCACACCPLVLL